MQSCPTRRRDGWPRVHAACCTCTFKRATAAVRAAAPPLPDDVLRAINEVHTELPNPMPKLHGASLQRKHQRRRPLSGDALGAAGQVHTELPNPMPQLHGASTSADGRH
eukprot:359767-Chlamydomonas_euryale.AAC.2